MLKKVLGFILTKSEERIGVTFEYARKILELNPSLFLRYGKVFGFLDPRKILPADAYHAARITGALTADCGSCVEAEINIAMNAGLDEKTVNNIVAKDYASLTEGVSSIIELSAAVTSFVDAPEAREKVIELYGEEGLVEVAFAMNGAVLLPGIKRAMGYATACHYKFNR